MGKDLEQRNHFLVGVFVMEVDVVDILEVMKDDDTASMLCGMDAVLFVKAGVPSAWIFRCSHNWSLC